VVCGLCSVIGALTLSTKQLTNSTKAHTLKCPLLGVPEPHIHHARCAGVGSVTLLNWRPMFDWSVVK
jgi:hypothetical protein